MKKKLKKVEACFNIWDFYLFYGLFFFELLNLTFYKGINVFSWTVLFATVLTIITVCGKLPRTIVGLIDIRFSKIINSIRQFNK